MKRACSPGGTGWPLFDFKVKNINAINKRLEGLPEQNWRPWRHLSIGIQLTIPHSDRMQDGNAESHAKSGIPHAWLKYLPPFDKPEIAITVLIEEAVRV